LSWDVIVVGAGPSGSIAGKECAEKGLKVAMVEKNSQAGLKVCAGALEYNILSEFNIEDSVVECYPQRFFICGEKLRTTREEKSITVYRRNFDRYLADSAVESGARLFTSTRCIKVLKKNQNIIGIVTKTPKGFRKMLGKVIIAADGFYSITARSACIQPFYDASDVGLAVQYETYTNSRVKGDSVYLFFGKKISRCGYGWIYPKKHGYTVGLGCLLSRLQSSLTQNLAYLMTKHPVASKILRNVSKRSNLQAACIPLRPNRRICEHGIVVVGDAAGQVSSLSGNGIYYAMKAGVLAGKVVSDAISEDDVSRARLLEYEENWNCQFGKEITHQKQVLQKIEGQYNRYMQLQFFIQNYPRIGSIHKAISRIAKTFVNL